MNSAYRNVTYRKADKDDLDRIMSVIHDAQETLKEDGVDQWQDGFPGVDDVLDDMKMRSPYVILVDGKIAGFFVIAFGIEEDYVNPIKGTFRYSEPYGTIHRTAVSKEFKGRGLSHFMFLSAFEEIKKAGVNFARIDTHQDNRRMRHIMSREGFDESAVVILKVNGKERVVGEKRL